MRAARLQRLRRKLRRRHLDALLVTRPENRFYLSGFAAEDLSAAEPSAHLLVGRRGPLLLLTDFRYKEEARRQAPDWEVVLLRRGLVAHLPAVLEKHGCRRIGFEGDGLLWRTGDKLVETLARAGIEAKGVSGLVEDLRRVKDAGEIQAIARAVRVNEEVFQEVRTRLRPGMTERQVAWEIETVLRRAGASRASFPPIVASGPNGALPHATPSERELRTGEPIIIDMGLVLDGYCSDMTRTVVLGEADTLTRERLHLVRRAQEAATARARAGISGRELDRVARRYLADHGYGAAFGHSLGHGVGLAVHEAPSVGPRSRRLLPGASVVTIEPGIYLPGWGGVRLENMVVLEEGGCRELNRLPLLEENVC